MRICIDWLKERIEMNLRFTKILYCIVAIVACCIPLFLTCSNAPTSKPEDTKRTNDDRTKIIILKSFSINSSWTMSKWFCVYMKYLLHVLMNYTLYLLFLSLFSMVWELLVEMENICSCVIYKYRKIIYRVIIIVRPKRNEFHIIILYIIVSIIIIISIYFYFRYTYLCESLAETNPIQYSLANWLFFAINVPKMELDKSLINPSLVFALALLICIHYVEREVYTWKTQSHRKKSELI